jgi:dolichol-phosphate mannosyltransferase
MCRAYRKPVLERIPFEADGFEAVTEILVRAAKEGLLIREAPMKLGVRRAGESKMRILRTVRGHLGVLARVAAR